MSSPSSSTLPVDPRARHDLVHAVQAADEGRLAAARRPDDRGHRARAATARSMSVQDVGRRRTRRCSSSTSMPSAMRATSPPLKRPLRDEPRRQADHEHQRDEHERPGPGLAVPVVVGRDRVGEDLHRQRRDRLVQAAWCQKWLPNAVKSSGAVSPATRATASMMPVTMPGPRRPQHDRRRHRHSGTPERERGLAQRRRARGASSPRWCARRSAA